MIPDYEINFESLKNIVNEAVYERKTQMTLHLQLLHTLPKQLFNYEKGTAYFIDKHTIRITKEDGKEKEVRGDHILIATGSRPRIPANIKVDEQKNMTSRGKKKINYILIHMIIL